MRKLFVLGSIFLLAAFMLPAIAAQPEAPKEDITMNRSKKPVVFSHEAHKNVSCVKCHHPVDGKEDFRSCTTAGCHDKTGMTKEDKANPLSYFSIIHNKKAEKFESCLACHTKVAEAHPDKKKELLSCSGSSCHPKAAK